MSWEPFCIWVALPRGHDALFERDPIAFVRCVVVVAGVLLCLLLLLAALSDCVRFCAGRGG